MYPKNEPNNSWFGRRENVKKKSINALLINPLVFRYKRPRTFVFGLKLFPISETDQPVPFPRGGWFLATSALTSCVAPLEEFTSLRQPVKGGNTTLITISRTKLLHETARLHSPRPTWLQTPFSWIFVSFFHRLRLSVSFKWNKMSDEQLREGSLWEFSEYCAVWRYLISQNFVGRETIRSQIVTTHIIILSYLATVW